MLRTNKKPSKNIIKAFKNNNLDVKEREGIYSIFAEYYDVIMSDIDYESWFNYVLDICSKFGLNVSSVIELACGTGATLKYFALNGYRCTGIDKSRFMIDKAKQKMKGLSHIPELCVGDMTNYKSPKLYELVYSFNDSVNYLVDIKSLTDFLYTAYDLLQKGGLLIFDSSTEYNIIKNFSDPIYEEYKTFSFLWNNYYNKNTRMVKSHLDFLIYDTLEVYREEHIQNIFKDEVINRIGRSVGFSKIHSFNGFTFNKPYKKNDIIHYVMKK